MNLLDNILSQKARVVAIIGSAKNAGKTTTLNHILAHGTEQNLYFGLTSIGRDGEAEDILTRAEKPLIFLPSNTCIATAEKLLYQSKTDFKILDATGCFTPFGQVMIAENQKPGYIELVGPSTSQGLKIVSDIMQKLGIDLLLIDGSFDRRSSAVPDLADVVILATGAVLGRDIDTVIKKTVFYVKLLQLRTSDDHRLLDLARQIIADKKIALVNKDYSFEELEISSVLGREKEIADRIGQETQALIISGALVNSMLSAIRDKEIEVIVRNPTCIFTDRRTFNSFFSHGGKVSVTTEMHLIAITINPFSPNGTVLDPVVLHTELSKQVAAVPIFFLDKNQIMHDATE